MKSRPSSVAARRCQQAKTDPLFDDLEVPAITAARPPGDSVIRVSRSGAAPRSAGAALLRCSNR